VEQIIGRFDRDAEAYIRLQAPEYHVRSGHAKAAIALSRRKPARSQLPPGQRWKERRLPKVCWGRKLPRT
jgi:hypothetical protein